MERCHQILLCFFTSWELTLYGDPSVPCEYQSLTGTYLGASSSNQPSTMSIGLTHSIVQRLTYDQYINMISSKLGNPKVNPTRSYYLHRGKPSYHPLRGQP